MALPSLRNFDYDFGMSISLRPSRRKRIRRSDAAGIAWMVNREHYWTEEALREILKRVQVLCFDDGEEALSAGASAIKILETRMVSPSPDLIATTLALQANTLRCNGRIHEALKIYERAQSIPGLSPAGQHEVLSRKAVALVYSGRTGEGLNLLSAAMDLDPNPPMGHALRGWAHMENGDYEEGLQDCMVVIEYFEQVNVDDHAFLAAIINAANLISCEAGVTVETATLHRIRDAIPIYRATIPRSGSGYYRTQVLRYLLKRAEALVLARLGKLEGAISRLYRVVEKLENRQVDVSVR